MSWYYYYHLAEKHEDGKLYPLGPFNNKGDFKSVYSQSASFGRELAEYFENHGRKDGEDVHSKELLSAIWGEEYANDYLNGDKSGLYPPISLPYKDLPTGDFVKSGYCLIEDIALYEKWRSDDIDFDGFVDVLSSGEYARKMENELKFGPPKPVQDRWGEEYTPRSVREYSFYAWADYDCIEYQCFLIRQAAEILHEGFLIEEEKERLYVVLTQG